jgi:hypothetical protein
VQPQPPQVVPQQHAEVPHELAALANASGMGKPIAHARYATSVIVDTRRRRQRRQSIFAGFPNM